MSYELQQLKKRIYENKHIEKILEELNCHHIKPEQSGNLITAGLPDGDNTRSIQIRNCEELYSAIRSRGVDGDIYTIIGYILYETATFEEVKSKLYQIKQWIVNALEYDDFAFNDFGQAKPKKDFNWWLRPIQKERPKKIEIYKNEIIDERVLNQYINLPWMGWLQDGISIETQREYGIGLDVQSERVTIPIHNKDGKLIGVKGRYVGSDKRTLDEKKYTYLYRCAKSIELFNLHRALPYIKEKKECIVVEGGKSTMLLYSWNVKNAVSIDGDKISPVQVKLLKELGLNVDLIFAFDKDKDKEYILEQIKQIKGRRIFYLFDEDGLFDDPKASPVDNGYDVWNLLYENKIRL